MTRFVFKLPDVGEGTAEAEIVAWHVKLGDMVAEDAPLVDVMTDKATVEMTAPVAGVIVALNGAVGEMAPVGAALVEFETALPSPSMEGGGGDGGECAAIARKGARGAAFRSQIRNVARKAPRLPRCASPR